MIDNFPYCFRILIGLAFLWSVSSCESSNSDSENQAVALTPEDDELKMLQSFLEVGLGKEVVWKNHWKSEVGEFLSSDFNLVQSDSINPMEMPEKNPILPDDPLYPYQLPNPNGNGTMDIYSYKVEAQDAIDQPFLNPDSEVVWYREDGMKERLLFMGPSGMFEEGIWVNAETFLVFGYFQEESGYRPMAWIIDLGEHFVHRFELQKISEQYQPESYINQKIKKVDLSLNGV